MTLHEIDSYCHPCIVGCADNTQSIQADIVPPFAACVCSACLHCVCPSYSLETKSVATTGTDEERKKKMKKVRV